MRRATLILLAALLLIAATACRQQAPTAGGGGGVSLSIKSPDNGATVAAPVSLALSVDGVEIGPPESGLMHFHVYVGDSSDYVVFPSTEGEIPAPQGEQTLRVVLAQPNHDETGTSASVTVTVSGGEMGDQGGGGDYSGGEGGYGGYGGGG